MSTIRSIAGLVERGFLPPGHAAPLAALAERYAIAITPQMADLIRPGDFGDPIALQFVPDAREGTVLPDESADPIGDKRHEVVPGVIHRYPDRVLLKLTHACPVYCRFCFRREMVGPGGENVLTPDALEQAIDYIARTPAIFEVIVTGGDPLIVSPRRIADLAQRIAAITHVQVVRWHTRVPVVDPARVTGDLVDALKAGGKAVYVAIHVNHAREFTPAARAAIARLADAGIPLLGQTVLLKGVNAKVDVLADLFRACVSHRIKPYYLHHMDRAPGTSHFRTTIAEGQALMQALRGRLSGIALPTYILDIPGGVAKVPIGPTYIDGATVVDPDGRAHDYPERG
jgi:lysine 2,3-aminomutase